MIAKSTKPKFFIQGERDEICPLKRMYEFYAQVPEPKELVVIDGAGHLFDGKVLEVGDAIEDFSATTRRRRIEGLELTQADADGSS